ncbi:MAG: polyprenyl synthetase family protein [Alphaproteobacteria bacterium]|nr:polyprenyl synthetase family protein [Alphaproteobacteria bacterium]
MSLDLHAWSVDRRARVDAALEPLFGGVWPPSFVEVLRYPLFTGGKRMRPLYAVAAAEAVGGTADQAIPPGVAVELVHTYSLVHDDLPAMDDDDERRGRPTVHKAFGEDLAILSGDALLTEAFAVLARADAPAEVRLGWVDTLAEASGARGMVGGQVGDIGCGPGADLATVEAVHVRKTGALIRAAVVMGGLAARAELDVMARLGTYGDRIGFAFQVADDVLDADEDAGAEGPPSYVKLLGLEGTRKLAREAMQEALDAIAPLPRPEALIALARYTIDREV